MTIRRKCTLLDVLLLTPVLREFRERVGASRPIYVETNYPEVFDGNDVVDAASVFIVEERRALRLDGVECEDDYVDAHVMDAMAVGLLGDAFLGARRIELQRKRVELPAPAPYVVVDCDAEGAMKVALQEPDVSSATFVLVGERRCGEPRALAGAVDLRARPWDVHELAYVMDAAAAFVGGKGSHLAVACATDVPVWALVEPGWAARRCPFRRGVPFVVV